MNNKGFTLAELLAIVVILGLIMVLAAPNIGNQMEKNEENTVSILNTKIENASKLYVAKYYANSVVGAMNSDGTASIATFTLKELQQDGLLSLKGNDGCNGVSGNIIVTAKDRKIFYNFNDISNGNKCFNCTGLKDCTK